MTSNVGKLSHDRLIEVLDYNPQTGVWTWLIGNPKCKAGDIAGCICLTCDGKRYRYIGVDGYRYKSQRLAWFYMTRDWPDGQITQKDYDSLNDAFANLRVATCSQRNASARLRKDNTSGYKGVSWNKSVKKYQSYIKKDYKRINLGWFDDPWLAHLKYQEAAHHYHGNFARAS